MGKLTKAIADLAKEYEERLKRQILIEKLNASGKLRESISAKASEKGFEITSDEVYAYLLGEKGYKAKRAGSRQEKKEKLERIVRWMKSKGIRPYTKTSGGGTKFKKLSNPEKQYNQAAFFINRSMNRKGTIKRYGYKGSNIVEETFKAMSRKTDVLAEAYLEDIVSEIKSFKFENITIQ